MSKKLVIVESPAKSKKIKSFLGPNYFVEASVGHIRNLPVPKQMSEKEKEKYGAYAIDVNSPNFDAIFKTDPGKTKIATKLKNLVPQCDEIILATDPDREGEAIAWHLQEILKPAAAKNNVKFSRATWHEITKTAVLEGLKNKTTVNMSTVDAALARSYYDRLFGYSISPVLGKVIKHGASGGRVQSPALRLIVDREKERLNFNITDYFSIEGNFNTKQQIKLISTLQKIGERKIANGSSFDNQGNLKNPEKTLHLTKENIQKVSEFLNKKTYQIGDITEKPYTRKPPAPYTTSSFQQDAGTRLQLSSKQLMSIAQKLYEQGLITYMRTDSISLSQDGTMAARKQAIKLYGQNEVPKKPVFFKNNKKNSQEGHEAIRPSINSSKDFDTPQTIKTQLNKIDAKAYNVYQLIYNRTVASQMNPAKGITTTINIESVENNNSKNQVLFTTSQTTITEPGWTLLTKPVDEPENTTTNSSQKIKPNSPTILEKISETPHSTTPPARYTEPQLVATLEKLEIGRPSTYATIVTINQTRGYVEKQGQAMYPTFTGIKIAQYIEKNIPEFVTYDSTAKMEEELDEIENKTLTKTKYLQKHWQQIKKDVLPLGENINWDEVNKTSILELPQTNYYLEIGKKGTFLKKKNTEKTNNGFTPGAFLDEKTENLQKIDFTDNKTLQKIYDENIDKKDSKTLGELLEGHYKGWTVEVKTGKYGPYAQATNPNKKTDKPVNQSLPKESDINKLSLNDVKELFNEIKLPRQLNTQFFVGEGKKGNYIGYKKTAKSRKALFINLPEEHDPRTVSLEKVKELWDKEQENKTKK